MPRGRKPVDPNVPAAAPVVIDYTLDERKRASAIFALAMDSGLFLKGKIMKDPFDDSAETVLWSPDGHTDARGKATGRKYNVKTLAQLCKAVEVETHHAQLAAADEILSTVNKGEVPEEPPMVEVVFERQLG